MWRINTVTMNIDRSLALELDLPPLRFSNYDLVTEENNKLVNNGWSLELELQLNKTIVITPTNISSFTLLLIFGIR